MFLQGMRYNAPGPLGSSRVWTCQWANDHLCVMTHTEGTVGTIVKQINYPRLQWMGTELTEIELEYDASQQGDKEDDI